MQKRNSRTLKLIGEDKFQKISSAKVSIIGLGGVGGIAAEMLVRSGVSWLKLIDFDIYEESNLNRQIGSSYKNLGKLKVDVHKMRFLEINPDIRIHTFSERLGNENFEKLLSESQFILDMCDDLEAKKLISEYAIKNNIGFISAMGAGNRLDISNLRYTTLDKTSYCNLAKRLRKIIEKNNHKKIKCLYYEGENIKVNGVVGTIAPSPNYMGVRAAAELLNMIMEV